MTWTKLADGLPRHPKIVGLSDAAFRLHIYALCYASEQLTDGEIPAVSVPILAPKRAKKLTEELVLAGVWHDENHACSYCPPIVRGRYYLHGYLDYNQSAEEVEAARAQRSDKARRAARARWDHDKPDAPDDAPSMLGADAQQMPHDAPARPDPSLLNSLGGELHVERAAAAPPLDVNGQIRAHRWAAHVSSDEVDEAIFVLRQERISDAILIEALALAEAFPSKWKTRARALHASRQPARVERPACDRCGRSGLILDDNELAVPCPDCRPEAVVTVLRPDHQEATA
jgi:hypothetical protein